MGLELGFSSWYINDFLNKINKSVLSVQMELIDRAGASPEHRRN